LRITTPTQRALARQWIEETAEARPGFREHLRSVALEALAGPNLLLVRRGLMALSIVGTQADLPALDPLRASAVRGIAADARYAAFEIKHRAV